MRKVIIIGGGAAGYFTAINTKEANPNLEVIILEKGNEVLRKVRVSGGGRCNVTHACFEPKELIKNYPRGERELLGPFHQYMTGDTIEWFNSRGVPLTIEEDNRVFPVSNNSQSIIDCFQRAVNSLKIKVLKNHEVTDISHNEERWIITTPNKKFEANYVVIATGASKKIWHLCKKLNHSIIDPVPSLFSFNISDKQLKGMAGISVPNASLKLSGTKYESEGPLLITHWGLSGPTILKLSSFGAVYLANKNYKFDVEVNWINIDYNQNIDYLINFKNTHAKQKVSSRSPYKEISRRLWEYFLNISNIHIELNWGDMSKRQLEFLSSQLTKGKYNVNGRNTFKNEFVTAGGVDLKEINFKRFESKLHKNLFFAGEVLNIDAITGGFNFQNAWTGGYICAKSISESVAF